MQACPMRSLKQDRCSSRSGYGSRSVLRFPSPSGWLRFRRYGAPQCSTRQRGTAVIITADMLGAIGGASPDVETVSAEEGDLVILFRKGARLYAFCLWHSPPTGLELPRSLPCRLSN